MAVISMKQLLEAGVHFGHQTRRWTVSLSEDISFHFWVPTACLVTEVNTCF